MRKLTTKAPTLRAIAAEEREETESRPEHCVSEQEAIQLV